MQRQTFTAYKSTYITRIHVLSLKMKYVTISTLMQNRLSMLLWGSFTACNISHGIRIAATARAERRQWQKMSVKVLGSIGIYIDDFIHDHQSAELKN